MSPGHTASRQACRRRQATSSVTRDKDDYPSLDEMVITVTLKDAQGNGVTGAASSLRDTVKVKNAIPADSIWKEEGSGKYTARYIAQRESSGNKASLRLSDSSKDLQSEEFSIHLGVEPPQYVQGTKSHRKYNSGLPQTAFYGATFRVVPPHKRPPGDYDWSVDGVGGGPY